MDSEILTIDKNLVAVLTFKQDEDAAKVLAVPTHTFCDITAIVKPAPNADLRKLPDLCLTNIFGNLALLDLCSVSDTCKLFNFMAPLAINSSNNVVSNLSMELEVNDLAKILRKFGHFIARLDVKSHTKSRMLPNVIAHHCGESLRSLKLINCDFEYAVVPQLLQMFTNLEALRLWGTDIDIGDLLFPECPELVDLKLAHARIPSGFFNHYYPKLRYLDFRYTMIYNDHPLPEFLNKNTNLQKFSIGRIKFPVHNIETIRILMSKVTHLYDHSHYNYLQWLSDDNQIVKLFTFSDFETVKNITFPHLKELHFELGRLRVPDGIDFLKRHRLLTEIIILQRENRSDDILASCVEYIVHNFPQLERLETNVNERGSIDTLNSITYCQNIKTLKIASFLVAGEVLASFLTQMVSIDSLVQLELIYVRINGPLIEVISRFKNLHYLKLIDVDLLDELTRRKFDGQIHQPDQYEYTEKEQNTAKSLITLIPQLTDLRSLALRLSFLLREKDYKKIMEQGQINQSSTITPFSANSNISDQWFGRIVIERERI